MNQKHNFDKLARYLERKIVGQKGLINRLLIALLADGHVLVEGAPGLAKTRAIQMLGQGIEGDFHRVQFTPDLLPADITGTEVFHPNDGSFQFQKGPLFHNLILADEINRAPAKVQSALLEAMAERQITVAGTTWPLPDPFLVMATQNPIEQEGTYHLPEAQLDRFLMKFNLGYPEMQDELDMLGKLQMKHPIETIDTVVSAKQIIACQEEVRGVHVDPKVQQYILQLVTQTRESEHLLLGGSPRASIALFRAGQALAAMRGRNFVLPDDVKAIAEPVMTHRVILKPESRLRRITGQQVIGQIMEQVAVPVIANEASS